MRNGRVIPNESVGRRAWRRTRWFVRDRFPARPVRRQVQGVQLYLPWAHRLPDYAAAAPEYGQNLVELAELLAVDGQPIAVIDVGANVGDSTVQILNRIDAKVLCVEADSFYLRFLDRNVGADPRVTVEPRLLTLDDAATMTPVRVGGTTRFETTHGDDGAPTVSIAELKRRHSSLESLRLVKSDTDGYDTALVPALAAAWPGTTPVLFFEYDPALTRIVGNEPEQVWQDLAELGYVDVVTWDNAGRLVDAWPIDAWASKVPALSDEDRGVAERYWDVAVAHRDDAVGRTALQRLSRGSTD